MSSVLMRRLAAGVGELGAHAVRMIGPSPRVDGEHRIRARPGPACVVSVSDLMRMLEHLLHHTRPWAGP
ncbi:hypothetical protein K7G98_31925, partial [Saccharothrix sp. MB29]|nr:hypothetical protein [Saccharothrix sp. MB29]